MSAVAFIFVLWSNEEKNFLGPEWYFVAVPRVATVGKNWCDALLTVRSHVVIIHPCSGVAAYLLPAVVAVPGLSSGRSLDRWLQAARVEGSGAAVTQLQFPILPADGTVLIMLHLLLLFFVFLLLGKQEDRTLITYGSGEGPKGRGVPVTVVLHHPQGHVTYLPADVIRVWHVEWKQSIG